MGAVTDQPAKGSVCAAGGTAHVLAAALALAAGGLSSCIARDPDAPRGREHDRRVDLCGDPLPDAAIARCGTVRFRSSQTIGGLAFSSDGTRIAGAGYSTVFVWGSASGALLENVQRVPGPGYVGSVAVTADGQALTASVEGDRVHYEEFSGSIVVRDGSGRELLRLTDDDHGMTRFGGLALSPDGRLLAVAGSSARWEVHLRELPAGREVARIPCAVERPFVAFSEDSRTILVRGEKVELRDVASGRILRSFPAAATAGLPVAVSRGSAGIAIVEGGRSVRITGMGNGRDVSIGMTDGRDWIASVRFSPDGTKLAMSVNRDMYSWLGLWEAESGAQLWRAEGPVTGGLAFSPNGRTIAAAAGNGIRVLGVDSGAEQVKQDAPFGEATSLRFSPDGLRIASGDGFTTLRIWDAATGRCLEALGAPVCLGVVAFSPEPSGVALLRRVEDASLRDMLSGTKLSDLKMPVYRGLAIAVSGSGTIAEGHALGADEAVAANIWPDRYALHVRDGSGRELFRHGVGTMPPLAAAFTPDGRLLAIGGEDGVVRVFDIDARRQTARVDALEGEIHGLVFAGDGRTLAVGGAPATVRVVDVTTGECLRALDGHTGGATALAFAPDGTAVATGTRDGTARLWSLETGEETLRFPAAGSAVRSLCFSPDGRHLATGDDDTTVLVWDLQQLRSGNPGRCLEGGLPDS
jgi:WD40 repeat protein